MTTQNSLTRPTLLLIPYFATTSHIWHLKLRFRDKNFYVPYLPEYNAIFSFGLIRHLKTRDVFCVGIFLIVKRSRGICALVYLTTPYRQYSYVVSGGIGACFIDE